MKLTAFVALILMVACWGGRYAFNYHLGYYEQSYSSLNYQDLLTFIEFIIPPFLSIIWVVSLIRCKSRLWTTGTIIGLLVFMMLGRILPSSEQMLVYGLRDRLAHDNDVDNLRHFAQDFDQLPRTSDDLIGIKTNSKQYMREDLAKTILKEKYPFLSWVKGAGFDGPSYVHEEDGIVDVRWGAALAGHWGFSIRANGEKLDLPSLPYGKAVRLSDDIFVVYEP